MMVYNVYSETPSQLPSINKGQIGVRLPVCWQGKVSGTSLLFFQVPHSNFEPKKRGKCKKTLSIGLDSNDDKVISWWNRERREYFCQIYIFQLKPYQI